MGTVYTEPGVGSGNGWSANIHTYVSTLLNWGSKAWTGTFWSLDLLLVGKFP